VPFSNTFPDSPTVVRNLDNDAMRVIRRPVGDPRLDVDRAIEGDPQEGARHDMLGQAVPL
jgi:hypothetical protein